MKIFVGYPSEVRALAFELADFISSIAGCDVWIDKRSLVGGDDWNVERLRAQQRSDLVFHVISKAIAGRPGVVNREIRDTLRLVEDQPFGTTFAVFVRTDDFVPQEPLSKYQWIEMFRSDWRDQIRAVIEKKAIESSSSDRRAEVQATLSSPFVATTHELRENNQRYFSKVEYISYSGNGPYWEYINAKIFVEAMDHIYESRRLAKAEEGDDFGDSWSELHFSEHYCDGNVISILRKFHWYGAGAAHPNHGISSPKLLGCQKGVVDASAFLSSDREAALTLFQMSMDKIIEQIGEGSITWLYDKAEIEKDPIPQLGCYNLSPAGISFSFSPYQILPYAYGSNTALLSFKEVFDKVGLRRLPFVRMIERELEGVNALAR